jgi:energy-coupling factor transport system ATP-binding protein
VALALIEDLRFSYPDGIEAVRGVSLAVEAGERVLLLGPSGCGKSTVIRALAGLVPHFHGGRFAGRVEVAGLDTRRHGPAQLAGAVATVFQDPEDQVVLTLVGNEVAFGLENTGVASAEIPLRARAALAEVGAAWLVDRLTHELSGGELQRVCLAAALALEPRLLLLDEPTSQLDPAAAGSFLELLDALPCAAVLSEQRPGLPLRWADRVVFMEEGRILLDAPREEALAWLAKHRPAWVTGPEPPSASVPGPELCGLDRVSFAYGERTAVHDASLVLERGVVVALTGPNGSGKTTLAKLAAGLLEPATGAVRREGSAAYLCQDAGRYLVRDRADEEVALGLGGGITRARRALEEVGLAGLEARHPRDLSSGERERLALACVLATEPDLLVLDEPTRGVDPARKLELAELLRAGAAGRATLVVTHDVAFARAVADREVSLAPEREAVHA